MFDWLKRMNVFYDDEAGAGGGKEDEPLPFDDKPPEPPTPELPKPDLSGIMKSGSDFLDQGVQSVFGMFQQPQQTPAPQFQQQPTQTQPSPFDFQIEDPGAPDLSEFDEPTKKAIEGAARHYAAQAASQLAQRMRPAFEQTSQSIGQAQQAQVYAHQGRVINAIQQAKANLKANLDRVIEQYPHLAGDKETMDNLAMMIPYLAQDRIAKAAQQGAYNPQLVRDLAETYSERDLMNALGHAAMATGRWFPGQNQAVSLKAPNLSTTSRGTSKTSGMEGLTDIEQSELEAAKKWAGLTDEDLKPHLANRS